MPNKLYAVRVGRRPGIYNTWPECFSQVDGVPGAKYKSFATMEEAVDFMNMSGGPKAVVFEGDQATTVTPAGAPATAPRWQPTPGANAVPISLVGGRVVAPVNMGNQFGYPNQPPAWASGSWTQTPTYTPNSTVVVPKPAQLEYDKGFHIWTDGSCVKGQAGWAFLAVLDGVTITERYGPIETGPAGEVPTNQRAELTAILEALTYLRSLGSTITVESESAETASHEIKSHDLTVPATATIHTDSEYSMNCITKWAGNWVKNGWVSSSGGPVKNQDLIKRALALYDRTKDIFHHVAAHNGIVANERADALADKGREMSAPANQAGVWRPKTIPSGPLVPPQQPVEFQPAEEPDYDAGDYWG